MKQRVEGRRRRRLVVAAVAAFVLSIPVAVLAANLPTGNSTADPKFEVDGNLKSESTSTIDWVTDGANPGVISATRNANGTCTQNGSFTLGTPGVAGTGSLVCDGSAGNFADPNGFVQGSHEETGNNPQPWSVKAASSPKKGDLAEVYLYAKLFDSTFDADATVDDLAFVLDLTRLDVNGDTHADAEFNQAAQTDCGDTNANTVCQPRTANDVIVSFDLAQGGANPTTTFYVFRTSLGAGETCADAPQASIAKGGCYVEEAIPPTGPGGEPAAFATLNSSEIPAPPWKTVGCEKTSDNNSAQCSLRTTNIPARGNMEGFVDLTAFFGNDFSLCPGFAQSSVKTRSSDGLNASLQDTTGPIPISASVCGSILIKKFGPDGTTLLPGAGYTISPEVSDRAAGTSDIVYDGDIKQAGKPTATLSDLADANDGVVCVDHVLFGSYDITESQVPVGYIGDTTTHTINVTNPSTCADRLAAGGAADTTFTNKLGSILVKKTNGAGGALAGATFTFSPNPFTGTGTLAVADGSANDKADSNDGFVCVENVLKGSYDITESATPDGYFGSTATKTVVVSSASTCATHGTTPDATFQNKKSSIAILKVAKDHNCAAATPPAGCIPNSGNSRLYTGATFTITPNPLTGTGSLDITDNGTNDAFSSTGGVICIDNVVNLANTAANTNPVATSYSIVEKTANDANYKKDSSTQTVPNTLRDPCADRSTAAGGDTKVAPDASFTNIPLSKIEVIFTSSAGAGVTAATINCTGLTADGGSTDSDKSFSKLEPGTYNCQVVVDP